MRLSSGSGDGPRRRGCPFLAVPTARTVSALGPGLKERGREGCEEIVTQLWRQEGASGR